MAFFITSTAATRRNGICRSLILTATRTHRGHIVDPYRQSDELYAESYEEIVEAAWTIVRIVLNYEGAWREA